MIDDV